MSQDRPPEVGPYRPATAADRAWTAAECQREPIGASELIAELARERDRLQKERDALVASLRAAPMPIRESVLEDDLWDEQYDIWWHSHASEALLPLAPALDALRDPDKGHLPDQEDRKGARTFDPWEMRNRSIPHFPGDGDHSEERGNG